MQEIAVSYPVHLGVTEAGEGEDGRIRSAAGIGALLTDGIGDTIRVSLSEDPENEIPVARMIAGLFPKGAIRAGKTIRYSSPERKSEFYGKINGPLVLADMRKHELNESLWTSAGFIKKGKQIIRTDSSADLVLMSDIPDNLPDIVKIAATYNVYSSHKELPNVIPLFSPDKHESFDSHSGLRIVLIDSVEDTSILSKSTDKETLVLFSYPAENRNEVEVLMTDLAERNLTCNLILNPVLDIKDTDEFHIIASSILGKYVIDNSIAGIMITNNAKAANDEPVKTAFSILQNTDKRITRTIYLSCPTCGRTKFNLQETVKKVKAATGHLKGLKIAVMGCIVNGPGEMAGADYGYVGAAPGKVHIYKGTVPVLKNVPEEEAIDMLLKVIDENI
jgi:(E)-4-hydroxy-3-methylbut-2-enyl-diphosphate synthase